MAVQEKLAADEARSEAEESAEIAKAAELVAEQQRTEAERQADIAKQATKDALVAKDEALEARDEAEKSKQEEEIAKVAALKAKGEAEENEKAAIRAREGEQRAAYGARIGMAAAKIEENAFDTARNLLAACPAELRDWEWGYLQRLCEAGRDFHSPATVRAVAFGPDGKWFVTAGDDAQVQLWDPQSDVPTGTITGTGTLYAAAVSPDGTLLATRRRRSRGLDHTRGGRTKAARAARTHGPGPGRRLFVQRTVARVGCGRPHGVRLGLVLRAAGRRLAAGGPLRRRLVGRVLARRKAARHRR